MKDQLQTLREAVNELHNSFPEKERALTALAQLEAMAGEQEPVAQQHRGAYHPDETAVRDACVALTRIRDAADHWEGGWSGTKANAEHAINLLRYGSTAPVAQQPQAEAVPNVCASFYTESAELIGTTEAPIKRVEREDDGTLHVYIDHWPQQAAGHPPAVRKGGA